ncbi:hypothetical protein ACQCX5_06745 [Propionibacteriaceae bacterium G57]|uniref:hypothetical protein n=1 Tax=Aestuariimicrobium sp. G57 TaxID=3418485 RepID=UPI003DA7969C
MIPSHQPPEPPSRPPYDEQGQLQETEPYAKLSYWLNPALGVGALVVGGWFAVKAINAGDTVVALVAIAITALFVVNG